MKYRHQLFIVFLFLSSIFGQSKNEFVVADSAIYPSFTLDKNGLIHTVWVKGEYKHLYYSLLDKNGNVIVKSMKDEKSGWCGGGRVITRNENKIIVWTQGEGFISTGSAWIWGQQTKLYADTPKTLTQFNFDPEPRGAANAAFTDDTTYYVLWSGTTQPYYSTIKGHKRSTNLRSLGNNIVFSDSNETNTTQWHHNPIMLDIPGQFKYCVLWIDNRRSSNNIYARFFDYNDNPLTNSIQINDHTSVGDNILSFRAKVSNDGNIFIVWGDKIGSSWNVFLKGLNGAGQSITSSKRITNDEDHVCEYPTVDLAIDKESKIAVAWEVYNKEKYTRIIIRGLNTNSDKIGEISDQLSDSTHGYYFLDEIQFNNDDLYFMWTDLKSVSVKMWVIPKNEITSVQENSEQNNHLDKNAYLSVVGIYPNPFNNSTTINFIVKQRIQIKLRIVNVLGQEVSMLTDGVYEAGKYQVSFDANKLSNGIYFCNLIGGSNSITKKLVLLK